MIKIFQHPKLLPVGESGEVALGEFTLTYCAKPRLRYQKIRVHLSNGMIEVTWFWRIMDDHDQDAYFETIIYPAIRQFVASWSALPPARPLRNLLLPRD